jgi:hypothetical protein
VGDSLATEVVLLKKLGGNEVDGFIVPTWENKTFREQLNLLQKRNNR